MIPLPPTVNPNPVLSDVVPQNEAGLLATVVHAPSYSP